MSVHEQLAEDLALYALGALEGDAKTALEKHLEECASCRRELEELRGDSALLALTASGPRPPARARTRFLEATRKEPRLEARKARRQQWLGLAGWAALAAMILVAALLFNENRRLRSNLDQWAVLVERQKLELKQARRIADTLLASDRRQISVVPVGMKTPPPEGKAIYSEQQNGLVFVASNLPALPARKTYELWLIPTEGAPIPAGLFKPDARGAALVVNPPLPAGVEAKAFAVTVEPEQGSSTPTLPIIMMGASG